MTTTPTPAPDITTGPAAPSWPLPLWYALTRQYAELARGRAVEGRRTDAYREATGGMAALERLAADTGLTVAHREQPPGAPPALTLRRALTAAGGPPAPGPDALHATADAMVTALELDRRGRRP